jgi:hypothetical protein
MSIPYSRTLGILPSKFLPPEVFQASGVFVQHNIEETTLGRTMEIIRGPKPYRINFILNGILCACLADTARYY